MCGAFWGEEGKVLHHDSLLCLCQVAGGFWLPSGRIHDWAAVGALAFGGRRICVQLSRDIGVLSAELPQLHKGDEGRRLYSSRSAPSLPVAKDKVWWGTLYSGHEHQCLDGAEEHEEGASEGHSGEERRYNDSRECYLSLRGRYLGRCVDHECHWGEEFGVILAQRAVPDGFTWWIQPPLIVWVMFIAAGYL